MLYLKYISDILDIDCCCSVSQSHLTQLRPHGLPHAKPSCPLPSSGQIDDKIARVICPECNG